MKRAVNPQTGEVVFLINNQWTPPAQTAVNEAGDKAFLVGNEWVLDNQLPSLTPPPTEPEGTENPFMGALGRLSGLAGSAVEGIAQVAERAGDYLESTLPLTDLTPEEIEQEQQLQPLFDLADTLKNFEQDIGYSPSTKLSDLGDNPLNVVPFVAERIITSTPDMAAAMTVLPAYIGTRTYEILDERVKNDNKTLDDATVGDVSAALGAAVIEGTFERFATGRLFKPSAEGATALGRIGKETAVQSGTEAFQESVANLAETAGTEKGVDAGELGQIALESAIVGGGLGVTAQGAKEVLRRKKEEPEAEPSTETEAEDKIEEAVDPEAAVEEEVDTELDELLQPATETVEEPDVDTEAETEVVEEELPDDVGATEPDGTGTSVDVSGEPGGVPDTGVSDEADVPGVPDATSVEPTTQDGEILKPTTLTDVKFAEPPTDPNARYSPEAVASFNEDEIRRDGNSVAYSLGVPVKPGSLSVNGFSANAERTRFITNDSSGNLTTVIVDNDFIEIDNKVTGNFVRLPRRPELDPEANDRTEAIVRAAIGDAAVDQFFSSDPADIQKNVTTTLLGKDITPQISEINKLFEDKYLVSTTAATPEGTPEATPETTPETTSEREQTRRAIREGMEQDRAEAEELQKTLKESGELEAGPLNIRPRKVDLESPVLRDRVESLEVKEEYELAKQDAEKDDMAVKLPTWGKLTKDEKYIFLGALPQNATALDYTRAIGVLENYRTYVKQNGFDKEERSAIAGYEEARPVYSRTLGAELPRWGDLSEEARLAYLDVNKNNSPVQQDAGMMAIAESLGERGILELTPSTRERLRLQQSERVAQLNAQRRAELEAEQERQRKGETDEGRTGEKGITAFDPLTPAPLRSEVEAETTPTDGAKEPALTYQSDSAVQSEINEGGTVLGILDIISERASDRRVGVLAGELADLVRQIGIQMLDVKINFGKVKQGADGRFDPKTNTITLSGQDGEYTGTRSLTEAFVHETMHLLTDHVIDNRATYLKSIPDAEARKEAQNALNRLNQNFLRAKNRLGKRFNISTIKEFIAEAYSNSEFQMALIDLDRQDNLRRVAKGEQEKGYTPRNLLDDFRQFVRNVAQALGIAPETTAPNFKEVIDDIAQIVSLPTTDMRGRAISYAEKPKKSKKVKSKKDEVSLFKDNEDYKVENTIGESALRRSMKRASFTRAAEIFQNFRQRVRNWEEQLRMGGKIIETGPDANNMYTQVSLAVGKTEMLFRENIQPAVEKVHGTLNKLMKALEKDSNDTLAFLQKLTEALHEPERRRVKYIMYVPLSTKRTLTQAGKSISPAERRTQIVKLLESPRKLSDAQLKALRAELDTLVDKYKDPLGYSELRSEKNKAAMPVDIDAEFYNVTSLDSEASAKIREEYENIGKGKAEIDAFLDALSELRDATAQLDRQANYWSDPVSNFVGFYGWKNYVPLKGINKSDDILNFNSKRMRREFHETAQRFAGRETTSNNTVMQMLSDSARAASRAGRAEYLRTVYNAVNQGLVPNAKVKERIKFSDREIEIPKAKRENTILKHNKDGSIDVIEFADAKFAQAIRKTYEEASPVINIMNRVTGLFGQMHTRFNYAFAPLNFVRDSITNAFVASAELGPAALKDIIAVTSSQLIKGGVYKAGRMATLLETGNIAKMRELAKKDSMYKTLFEYLEQGGAVAYVQGLALNDKLKEMNREVTRTNKGVIATSANAIDLVASVYNNAFEFAARAGAYAAVKNRFMKNEGMSEADATIRAAAYVKNFANFEMIGEKGRELGAFFMFFRPAATGAVRAIEAVMPAFRTMNQAMRTLPPAVLQDPKALAEFKRNYRQRQKNAAITTAGLFGFGMSVFYMSALMSDEDELGRNAALNDNYKQWERYARFHIPKAWTESIGLEEPIIVQMPWGFGPGAFAAAGSQAAAALSGAQSATDAMASIFTSIALDSYLPIPISRMDPTEYPMNFFLDSVMPSFARPLVQFVVNRDGLGRGIYPESYRRVVDAYSGSDRVPVMYRDASRYLFEESGGDTNIPPNTLYFLANSYIDGFSRLVHDGYGAFQLASGDKAFRPKSDTYLFSSFFGSKSNIESRDFARVEKQFRDKSAIMKGLENRPEAMATRMEKYPMDAVLVQMYNHDINQALRDLRSEANRIRRDPNLSDKDRVELLRPNMLMQRLIKRNLLDKYEAYDIKP